MSSGEKSREITSSVSKPIVSQIKLSFELVNVNGMIRNLSIRLLNLPLIGGVF